MVKEKELRSKIACGHPKKKLNENIHCGYFWVVRLLVCLCIPVYMIPVLYNEHIILL